MEALWVLGPKVSYNVRLFYSTGGVLGSSASFASAGGSTLDSGFGVSVFGVDGSVSIANPCPLMGIPAEISVMPDDDSLPRPHPLTLCPSSPSLTAASTFESTACHAGDRVGVAGDFAQPLQLRGYIGARASGRPCLQLSPPPGFGNPLIFGEASSELVPD